jgi:hypothetical protein
MVVFSWGGSGLLLAEISRCYVLWKARGTLGIAALRMFKTLAGPIGVDFSIIYIKLNDCQNKILRAGRASILARDREGNAA